MNGCAPEGNIRTSRSSPLNCILFQAHFFPLILLLQEKKSLQCHYYPPGAFLPVKGCYFALLLKAKTGDAVRTDCTIVVLSEPFQLFSFKRQPLIRPELSCKDNQCLIISVIEFKVLRGLLLLLSLCLPNKLE